MPADDSAFASAVAIVLVNEGGDRFTNPTAASSGDAISFDRGGPTRFGITQSTLAAWRKKPVGVNDVRTLTEAEARAIYQANYWAPLRCGDYGNRGLATAVLDAGVLTGVGNAARQLQTALGNLVVDGNIGPKTVAAVQAADPIATVIAFSGSMQRYLIGLVQRDASQQVFLINWLKRAAVMQAMPFLYA